MECFNTYFAFILKPIQISKKVVCQACADRGEVLSSCSCCEGLGTVGKGITRFAIKDECIEIIKVDRNPNTGVIRYWEALNSYYPETITPETNEFFPDVPFGIHLVHKDMSSALAEANRINKFLDQVNIDNF